MGGAGRQRESGGAWRERGRAQMGHVGRERREGERLGRIRPSREEGEGIFLFFLFLFSFP
jgi:hypothetical protein